MGVVFGWGIAIVGVCVLSFLCWADFWRVKAEVDGLDSSLDGLF